MLITRAVHPKLLLPGVKDFFGAKYKEYEEKWSKIFDIASSDRSYEEIVEESGFGLASVKGEGQAIGYDSTTEGYTTRFTHVNYGLGFVVTEEEVDDNLYGDKAFSRAAALARSMRITKEIVHANVLNRSQSSSYVGGDTKALVASDHPTLNGTQSNLLTGANLSETALEDAIVAIMNAKDSRGLNIMARPVKLIVSPNDAFNAARIVNAAMQTNTAFLNNPMAIKELGFMPEVVVNPYLDDTNQWFLTTDVENGLKHMKRKALRFAEDGDFDTGNLKHKAQDRYSAGWADWRGVFGNSGAT